MIREEQVAGSYRLQRRCERCQGQGHIVVRLCSECGQQSMAQTATSDEGEDALPCEHGAAAYVESEVSCGACAGRGRVVQTVGKGEYDAAMRRRLRRGVILFLLALVPLAALSWAVLSADPGVVCGSWWYGILLPVAMVAGRVSRRTAPKKMLTGKLSGDANH